MSTLATTFLVNNPLEQFEINDFVFILAPIFGFTKLSLTNIGFYLIMVVAITIGMNVLSRNNGYVIPSRWAIHSESVYGSILNLVREQIGPKNEVYVPFIFALFNFVLISNLVGLVPYSFTTTSHLVLTMSLATAILIGVTIIGFQRHGLGFFAFFIPAGTPLALVFLLVAIELISYLARAVSLGVRLGANMIAGHSLLKIISTFTWKMVVAGPVLLLVSLLPLLFLTALAGLEFGIGILQAYVFTILTCSYLKDAIDLH
jgi:F-type H+-transporting ATPase subunit a